MELEPQFRTESEITRLVLQFQAHDLPKAEWTHQAHLATAMWYLQRYSREEAICWLRTGIISFNLACGGKNTPTSGYHETLTLFWIGTIDHFMEQAGRNRPLIDLCRAFLDSGLADPCNAARQSSQRPLLRVAARRGSPWKRFRAP